MSVVFRARVYGFCMGVRRAMDTALKESERKTGDVYTLGPLIHNPTALDLLAEKGVRVLNERQLPESLAGAIVIIRAHGVPPALAAEIVRRGAVLVDATCPRVRLSQKKAEMYSEQGYTLFLAGEAEHGEIIGIAAYAPGCVVVSSPQEAKEAAKALHEQNPDAKVALIGQTTIKSTEYSDIAREIKVFFDQIEIFDGICPATLDRQKALRELCDKTDAIVVVGGRSSANTKRLYLSALEYGKPAWLVENADELTSETCTYEKIGLTAGASTPDAIIDAVEEKLRSGC